VSDLVGKFIFQIGQLYILVQCINISSRRAQEMFLQTSGEGGREEGALNCSSSTSVYCLL